MQVQHAIEASFPGIEVLQSNYPPPPTKVAVSKVVGAVQVGVIALALAGETIFPALGLPVPEILLRYKDHKFAVVFGAWFVGNMLWNGLVSTGAFEVYYNGVEVFSKLKTGMSPEFDAIIYGITKEMQAAQ